MNTLLAACMKRLCFQNTGFQNPSFQNASFQNSRLHPRSQNNYSQNNYFQNSRSENDCLQNHRLQHAAGRLMRRCVPWAATLLLSCVLVACGGNARIGGEGPVGLNAQTSEQVRELLADAQSSESPERDHKYLQAAELLVQANEVDWARNLLSSIDPDVLFNEDFVTYTMLYSRIAIDQDAPFLAQRILTNPRIEQQWNSLSPEAAQTLRARRAELFALLGESADSIQERISLSRYLITDEERTANQDAIWRSLMSLPLTELERLSQEASEPMVEGWYRLAAISKSSEADLEMQQAEIDRWMTRWPQHPAATHPPSDLQLLRQLVEEQPRQVALLLPLQGTLEKSGKAVRDGFMAAYYAAKNRNSRVPEVRIFDTSAGNIDEVYQLALDDGAEFIIGPLEKESVGQLNLRLNLPVPTLALNEVDNAFGYPDGLYQFGLGPEDEAKQVARRAWLEGHRTAMLLIEQSGDAGSRAADTFISEWTKLGGTVVNQTYFDTGTNYNQIIQSALLVTDSHERRRNLQRLLGKPLEFQARRRHDIDMIFLFARPETARQIKPTLAFHDAGGLPIFATRRVYVGSGNMKNDRDLNDIRFSTLPWMFNSQCPQKEAIVEHAKPSDNYSHLYALGVDAFRLYPRLPLLEQISGAKFYGCTGALQLLASRKIEREQVWARISDGRAVPLPMVVSEAIIE